MRTVSSGWLPGLLVLAAALFTLTLTDAPAEATTFHPAGDFTLANTAPGAKSDLTIDVQIDSPDALFAGLITFIPPEWGIGSCPANDPDSANSGCAGDVLPIGAVVGELNSNATLGLLNNPCVSVLPLEFGLVNATVDMSATVVFHDTDANDVGEMFEDADSSGIPDGAELWPDFLSRLVRDVPFPGGDPLQPIMRTYGQVDISGSEVGVQFLFLEPGVAVNGLALDASLGIPVVLVLQDIGDPGATRAPSAITDFCSPFTSSQTIFGLTLDNPATGVAGVDEGGEPVLTNPADGGYNFVTFIASEYDEDGDGIPNPLDPCPLTGNTLGWDPRVPQPSGDTDGDGLPDLCDPDSSASDIDQDHDNDGWVNRGDNCTTTANTGQADIDRDGIGDLCDAGPVTPSLHQHFKCVVKEIDVGAGGDPPATTGGVLPCVLSVVKGLYRGNVDCSETGVNPIDSLHILRYDASIWPAPACIDAGDINCDEAIDVQDALQVLRFEAGLEISQEPGCSAPGTLIVD